MSTKPKGPIDIQALVLKWKDGKALSDDEIELALEALQGRARETALTSANGDVGDLAFDDEVTWAASVCVDGNPVTINGEPFVGTMRKPVHVFHAWKRIWQQDYLAHIELFQKRGNVEGTVGRHIQFVPPNVDVRRAVA